MAWTATTGVSYQAGNLVMTVVYLDNGSERFEERFLNDGTPKSLKQAVLAWIAKRDETTHALKCVPAGITVTLDPDPVPPPPQPTADEILARDFMPAWRLYQCLKVADAEKLGTTAQNNAVTSELASAKSAVQALYRQKPAVCIPLMGP